jgi:hypothetical protein
MKTSFDFDDSLALNDYVHSGWGIPERIMSPNKKMIDIVKEHYAAGDECVILTARIDSPEMREEIYDFLKEQDIFHMFTDFFFTNHSYKGPVACNFDIELHYDDDLDQIASCQAFGIKTINVADL